MKYDEALKDQVCESRRRKISRVEGKPCNIQTLRSTYSKCETLSSGRSTMILFTKHSTLLLHCGFDIPLRVVNCQPSCDSTRKMVTSLEVVIELWIRKSNNKTVAEFCVTAEGTRAPKPHEMVDNVLFLVSLSNLCSVYNLPLNGSLNLMQVIFPPICQYVPKNRVQFQPKNTRK